MRNKYLIILICAGISIGLFSCKENRRFYRKAGLYSVEKHEIVYYNLEGGIDSTSTREDIGTIGLYYNDSDTYNDVTYSLNYIPGGFGSSNLYWYIDNYDATTITFWYNLEYGTTFTLYHIDKKVGKKETWTTVYTNAEGGIGRKEILTLKQD
jgi:hypothetical protein